MKRILFHGLSWSWVLLVFSVILLAIIITALRVAAPLLSDYRSEIESQISEMIDRPVEIESLDLSMQGFYPVLRINNVKVLSRADRVTVFDFDSLKLVVNPWQSLLKKNLVPSDIVLTGSHLSFIRKLDGTITVSGFQLGAGGELPEERLDLLTHLTFRLSDIEVYWQDDPLGTTYQFVSKEMQVRVSPQSIDLQGEIQLPEGMGKNVSLAMNIDGPVTNSLDWEGEFYISAPLVELPLLPLEFTAQLPVVENGAVTLRSWGQWHGKKLKLVTGNLGMKDVLIRPRLSAEGKIPPLFRLDSLQTRFNAYEIEQGWQIDTDQTQITSIEKNWPDSALSLSLQKFSDQWLLRGTTTYLDIDSLDPLLRVLLPGEHAAATAIRQAEPMGQISDLLFSWWSPKSGAKNTFAASGVFKDIGWNSWNKIPGLDNLDGSFDFDQDDGKILLSSKDSSIDVPALFEQPLWTESINSELIWQINEHQAIELSASNFELQNEDIQLQGKAKLLLREKDKKPELFLEASLPGLSMEKIRNYLPVGILPKKTGKWLNNAFVAGEASNATLSYRGELSAAAFKSGEAEMLAEFDVQDAVLDYKKEWPVIKGISARVFFKNASIQVDADAATVSNSQLKKGQAVIADFYKAELNLDLDVEGPLSGGLKYLRDIPLSKGLEPVLDAAETSGPVDVALKLDLTLSKKLKKKLSLNGRVNFRNNTLSFPENKITATNVLGFLDFTESGYTAEGVVADFRGSPIEIGVKTADDRAVDIAISGIFSVDQLLPGNKLLPKIARGKSSWVGTIKVPAKKRRSTTPTTLHMTSSLKGTRIDFPAPLGKISLVERDFYLQTPLGKTKPEISFNYAPVFFGKLELKGKGHEAVIDRAVVSLSEQSLRLPETGIDIIGHWPILDTVSWEKRFRELSEQSEGDSLGEQVNRVSVSLSEWFIAGQQFSNVQLTAARSTDYWRANVNGDSISGFLRIPKKIQSTSVLEGEFEKLYLRKSTVAGESISPRELPALKVTVDDFQWQEATLGSVLLNTEKDLWGMQINQLNISSTDLNAQATGQWRESDQGQQQTKLDYAIQSGNLGKTLSDLEISQTLKGGKGNLRGSIQWDEAPFKLAFSSWNGDVAVDVKEGRLSKVNPGFGRVLGLLNVEKLPKRLALQFSDVSGEGFEFDKLGGSVSLVDGEAYMQNFNIDSTSAEMKLSGSINMPQKLYDLKLDVIPKLTGTVPLAAGIIAGPQAGAVAYLVDKLASKAGVDFNKAIEKNYLITGEWDAPLVESINIQSADSEELLPGQELQ